jgi:hypothetical protein
MSECDDIDRVIVRLPAAVQVTVRERVGIPGPQGQAARELQVRVDNNILQAKYTDEPTWVNLKDFSQPIWGGKFGPPE